MDRKKELKQQYKEMKPDMGVFMFKCKPTGTMYLGIDQNIKGTLNSIRFQLRSGSFFTNRELEADWRKYGAEGFEISILEVLEYDKDPSKTDYMDDLRALRDLWREKLGDVKYIKK